VSGGDEALDGGVSDQARAEPEFELGAATDVLQCFLECSCGESGRPIAQAAEDRAVGMVGICQLVLDECGHRPTRQCDLPW